MVLLVLRECVELNLKMLRLGMQDTFNWKAIEHEIALTFGVKEVDVIDLRQQLMMTGEVAACARDGCCGSEGRSRRGSSSKK